MWSALLDVFLHMLIELSLLKKNNKIFFCGIMVVAECSWNLLLNIMAKFLSSPSALLPLLHPWGNYTMMSLQQKEYTLIPLLLFHCLALCPLWPQSPNTFAPPFLPFPCHAHFCLCTTPCQHLPLCSYPFLKPGTDEKMWCFLSTNQ